MKHFSKQLIVNILTFEAKLLLRRTKPTIIAVTGSVGKTSVKDSIYQVIKDKVRARKSEKSYNSEIGVPLSILGLPNAWNNPFYWLKNLFDGGDRRYVPCRKCIRQWVALLASCHVSASCGLGF